MKARGEIMGRCVVNIQTASEIGKIRDILIDPEIRGIAYYVLAEPSDYFGARLIDQKHAVGIGGFALTVTGEEIIEDVAHCPRAIDLLRGDIRVVGTYALTDRGVLLGMIKEIFFDETTGGIVRYRIRDDEGRAFDIEGADVITLGSHFTILLDDSELMDVVEDVNEYEDGYERGYEEQVLEEDYAQEESLSYEDQSALRSTEHFLEVSARPMSAAELALTRAAESLRKKYAEEAVRVHSGGMAEDSRAIADGTEKVYRAKDTEREALVSSNRRERGNRGDGIDGSERKAHGERRDRADYRDRSARMEQAPYPEKAGGTESAAQAERSVRVEQPAGRESSSGRETLERGSSGRGSSEREKSSGRERPAEREGAVEARRPMEAGRSMEVGRSVEARRSVEVRQAAGTEPTFRVERSVEAEPSVKGSSSYGERSAKAQGEISKGAAVYMNVSAAAETAEKIMTEDRVTGGDGAAGEEMGHGTGKGSGGSGVVKFPDKPHEKESLAASEIIYPKHFNLFDRRQMQYLLGKRLFQAVQLESGEVMEEGEYITAEMLSLVRSRNTLMELTAHVRKA